MRHRMYPVEPLVYQDIFDARDAKAIQKRGQPAGYNDTRHAKLWDGKSGTVWNDRRLICFGEKATGDAGALVTVPKGYDTLWVAGARRFALLHPGQVYRRCQGRVGLLDRG
jgi:hypothetical protein